MTETELHQLLVARNSTRIPYRENACVHQWFEEQAARTPGATAVIFRGHRMSYRELDEKSARVAARLHELGAVPDSVVAICVERSLEMFVGLLGILKSGAAYLPLDPAFPQERQQFILADSGAAIVVTQDSLLARLPDSTARAVTISSLLDAPGSAPTAPSAVAGGHLAYLIYTSGSTGKPKGVMVEHRQVSNFFTAMDVVIGPEPGVWLAVTSISFDISVLELFWTLARGFTVVLQPEKTAESGGYSVRAQIAAHQITHFQCTPSMARLLASDGETLSALRPLRCLMLGGEALPSALAAQLRQSVSGRIFNLYGPTETTVWSAAHELVHDESPVPIGHPIANTQIYIVDEQQRPLPDGESGELCIGGAGVTRGYHQRPDLTAARFLPDPFVAGNRIYRTGDLARYRSDGNLEFLGRIDNQVKILGFRIEPEEIEDCLGRHPNIRAVGVIAREDVPGEKNLIAWVVPDQRSLTAGDVRAYAQQHLPAHMVPSGFVFTDALPLTPNGKVDRKALAVMKGPTATLSVVPAAELPGIVMSVFQEALGVETLSPTENFFDLGANSLTMAQAAIALQEALHREVPLTDLFQYPTISELSAHLSQRAGSAAPSRASSKRAQSRKEALLDRTTHRRGGGRQQLRD